MFLEELGSLITTGIRYIFGQEIGSGHSSKTQEHTRKKIQRIVEGSVTQRNYCQYHWALQTNIALASKCAQWRVIVVILKVILFVVSRVLHLNWRCHELFCMVGPCLSVTRFYEMKREEIWDLLMWVYLFFSVCSSRVRSIIMLQEKAQDRERLLLKFIKIMKVSAWFLLWITHIAP